MVLTARKLSSGQSAVSALPTAVRKDGKGERVSFEAFVRGSGCIYLYEEMVKAEGFGGSLPEVKRSPLRSRAGHSWDCKGDQDNT